jgi:hypothetical protein
VLPLHVIEQDLVEFGIMALGSFAINYNLKVLLGLFFAIVVVYRF